MVLATGFGCIVSEARFVLSTIVGASVSVSYASFLETCSSDMIRVVGTEYLLTHGGAGEHSPRIATKSSVCEVIRGWARLFTYVRSLVVSGNPLLMLGIGAARNKNAARLIGAADESMTSF